MTHYPPAWFLVLWTASFLNGCDKGSAAPPAPGMHAASRKQTVDSNGGEYQIQYESAPDPIPTNEPFDLTFKVAPKKGGNEAGGLTVAVDARMPAHFHGMNRVPKISRQPDGSYKAEGMLFHMPGHWELYFDITQSGRTERAQVDIHLK